MSGRPSEAIARVQKKPAVVPMISGFIRYFGSLLISSKTLGSEVTICCDGQSLEEYDVGEYDEDDELTVECYIASEAGQEFTICWSEDNPATDMQVDCYIDGQLVDQIAHVADVGRDKSYGVTISQEQYRPYVFAEVLTTENRRIATPAFQNSLFGTIVVMLTAVDYWRPAFKHTPFSLERVEDPRPIHAKDAVAGGHTVRFGRPTNHPLSGRRRGYSIQVPVGSEGVKPFLCFCFIYMPKELLQAEGLLPELCSPEETDRQDGPSSSSSSSTFSSSPSHHSDTRANDLVIELFSESGGELRVPSPLAAEGGTANAQAQVEAEVRDLEAQMDKLRQQLVMKKRLLANSTSEPTNPSACYPRERP